MKNYVPLLCKHFINFLILNIMNNSDFTLEYAKRLNFLVYIFNQYAQLGYHVSMVTNECNLFLTSLSIIIDDKAEAYNVCFSIDEVYGKMFTIELHEVSDFYYVSITSK